MTQTTTHEDVWNYWIGRNNGKIFCQVCNHTMMIKQKYGIYNKGGTWDIVKYEYRNSPGFIPACHKCVRECGKTNLSHFITQKYGLDQIRKFNNWINENM